MAAAIAHTVVSFQTDSFTDTAEGWTVNVTGHTRPIGSHDKKFQQGEETDEHLGPDFALMLAHGAGLRGSPFASWSSLEGVAEFVEGLDFPD